MCAYLWGIINCTLTCFPCPQADVMWFWALNCYAHLDLFYGILLNFECSFQSMVPNTHCRAYNQGLSVSSIRIAWKIFLRKVHMVSSLSSISFRCNLQQSQLLHWISNKFWIDMHVCLLSQWDCHLPDPRIIIFRSFLEVSLPTSGPIATHFTTRHRLRCLFGTY